MNLALRQSCSRTIRVLNGKGIGNFGVVPEMLDIYICTSISFCFACTAEAEFEFITWVSLEATTDFCSSSGRTSFSLFVDICKWYVNEQWEKSHYWNRDQWWLFRVGHCQNKNWQWFPMKLKWWTQTLPEAYRIHLFRNFYSTCFIYLDQP